ncbi:hypothetical protein ACH47Z_29610 [Streptomyces sp. NPDC020192]|uniref:hypothetical protein n=1 Tax=Streptomyces sp. NPDC020192 TaxID=3365066 RepID=UPI0037963D72
MHGQRDAERLADGGQFAGAAQTAPVVVVARQDLYRVPLDRGPQMPVHEPGLLDDPRRIERLAPVVPDGGAAVQRGDFGGGPRAQPP